MKRQDLEEIGFRTFTNAKKKDGRSRLHWSHFPNAGDIINIVLVKGKRWEVESVFVQGEKMEHVVRAAGNIKDLEIAVTVVNLFKDHA